MKNKNSVCTKKKKPSEKNEADDEAAPSKVKQNISEQIWIENQLLIKKTTTSLIEISYRRSRRTGKIVAHRKTLESSTSVEEFILNQVDKAKLAKIRATKEPVFIVKEYDTFYYAKIPFDMSLLNTVSVEHKCAPRDGICKRLSPKPDSLGGCAKVRDKDPHIEDYSWIKRGYETVNTETESFIVIECEHNEIIHENVKLPKKEETTEKKKVGGKKGKTETKVEPEGNIWDKIRIRF